MKSEIDLYTTNEEDSDLSGLDSPKEKSETNSKDDEIQENMGEEQEPEQEQELQEEWNWRDSDNEME